MKQENSLSQNSKSDELDAQKKRIADLENECEQLRKLAKKARISKSAIPPGWLRRLERSVRTGRKKLLGTLRGIPLPTELPDRVREPAKNEKRRKSSKGPSIFNAHFYLRQNPEAKEAGISPWEHYSTTGWQQGFNPHPMFNVRWYLEQYPEIQKSGAEPLMHYLQKGWEEEKNPHPWFDGVWYRNYYSDVKESKAEPLQHFARFGWKELRMPNEQGDAAWLSEFIVDGSLVSGTEPPRKYITELAENCSCLDSSRPTILVISHDASRTGAPTIALTLATHLSKANNVISMLIRTGPLADNFRQQSRFTIEPNEGASLDAWGVHLWLDLFLERAPISYAIVNSIESCFLLPCLARKDVPTINLIHEFMAYTRPLNKIREAVFHGGLSIFPAKLVQEDALKTCPDLWEPGTRVLAQGLCPLPSSEKSPIEKEDEKLIIRAALRPPGWEQAVVVVGMGTVQMRKGIDLFLACAAKVVERNPRKMVRFVWFGSGYDPEYDVDFSVFIADHLRKLEATGAIFLFSAVSQPELVYELADIYFLSSRLDPFPLVAQEAMAAGMPLICFEQATGIVEILRQDSVCGECVIPHLDVEVATILVQQLIDDPGRRHQIGERNRSLAERLFDSEKYACQIEAAAVEVCAAKKREKLDREEISCSNLLDRSFVVSSFHTGVSGDVAAWYARSWASGMNRRKPFPGFHPGIYKELQGAEDRDPLAHFLAAGQPAGPWQQSVLLPTTSPGGLNSGRAALHIHIFYPEMVEDLVNRLNVNATSVDLFITMPEILAGRMEDRWAAYHRGKIEYLVVPNMGRDIGALLTGLDESPFWTYEFIGHLHTKQSAWLRHAGYVDLWRIFLLENAVGGKFPMMDLALSRMADDLRLGLVYPDDPNILSWGPNLPFAEDLAARMSFDKPLPEAINFPVGTFFWARPEALLALRQLNLSWTDYPPEPAVSDGSILHAIERLIPLVVAESGHTSAVTHIPGLTR